MLLLCLDTETTGLCSKTDFITELGYIVWDTDKGAPVKLYNVALNWPDMPPLSAEIQKLTGITPGHLETWGATDGEIPAEFAALAAFMERCDYIVAHNAPFDKGMVATGFSRVGVGMPDKIWIDTCIDLPFGPDKKSRNLNHACSEHKINPNQFAHRALFDVMQMIQLLSKYDISEVVKRAKSPNVVIEAVCRKPWEDSNSDGEKDTDKAKANGFRFDGTTKKWTRGAKDFEAEALLATLPFPARIKANE